MELEHAHLLRPTNLVGLASEAFRLERGHCDRLAKVADVDGLEIPLGSDDRQERQARHRREAIGQIVLGPEDKGWPDDRRGGKSLT